MAAPQYCLWLLITALNPSKSQSNPDPRRATHAVRQHAADPTDKTTRLDLNVDLGPTLPYPDCRRPLCAGRQRAADLPDQPRWCHRPQPLHRLGRLPVAGLEKRWQRDRLDDDHLAAAADAQRAGPRGRSPAHPPQRPGVRAKRRSSTVYMARFGLPARLQRHLSGAHFRLGDRAGVRMSRRNEQSTHDIESAPYAAPLQCSSRHCSQHIHASMPTVCLVSQRSYWSSCRHGRALWWRRRSCGSRMASSIFSTPQTRAQQSLPVHLS